MGTLNVDSPSMRRILSVLEKHGDLDAEDIALEAHVSQNSLSSGGYLRYLILQGKIHIAAYRRNFVGSASPIYRLGPGKPAKKPRAYTDAEKSKRWRMRTGYRSKGKGFLVGVVLNAIADGARKTDE